MVKKFEVLYSFEAEEEASEMSVTKGDIVQLNISDPNEDDTKDGWVLVESTTVSGINGYVPEAYLRPLPEEEEDMPAEEALPPPPTPSLPPTPQQYAPAPVQSIPASQLQGGTGVFSAPVRRLSDPRIASRLLGAMDPLQDVSSRSAGGGGSSAPSPAVAPSPLAPNPYAGGYGGGGVSYGGGGASYAGASTPSGMPTPSLAEIGGTTPLGAAILGSGGDGSGKPAVLGGGKPLPESAKVALSRARANMQTDTASSTKLFSSIRQEVARSSAAAPASPRAPALHTAVQAENYDELLNRNEDFYDKVKGARKDTFSKMTDMCDALSENVVHAMQESHALTDKISGLMEAVEAEKNKWRKQVELEKAAKTQMAIDMSSKASNSQNSIKAFTRKLET